MRTELALVDRFFKVLVEEICESHPEYLDASFTVAEVYQSLVPYRTHRDRIGAEMNGDYEDALLRLLAGEGGYLVLDSDTARERILLELRSSNPNTGMYREYAAVRVRLSEDVRKSLPSEPGKAGPSPQTELEVEAGGSQQPVRGAGELEHTVSGEQTTTAADEAAGTAVSSASGSRSSAMDSTGGAEAMRREKASGGFDRDAEPSRPDSCPDCGAALPARASLRFCAECGANVFVAPCGECGEVLERNWKFCIACGVPAP